MTTRERVPPAGRFAGGLAALDSAELRGLIECLPRLQGNGRLGAITGAMPGLRALPSGCRFHPRCPIAEPRCSLDSPALRELAAGHLAACHLAGAR